jgi:hypothetical protein
MENQQRMHRPEPARTEPNRNSATYLRDPIAGSGAKAGPAEKGSSGTADDAVSLGVKLGYRVIEEQISEGQRLAQRLRHAADATTSKEAGDFGPLFGRVLHLYKDMGALCYDALEALARGSVLRSGLPRTWSGKTDVEQAPAASSGAVYAIEITSPWRTQVSLELRQGPQHSIPLVHALHAPDPAIPPLTNVRFSLEPATRAPMLEVNIPNTQRPATYTGVVVDSGTNEPCGTLCVRLVP